MEKYIRHEGGYSATNKTTFKSRCANVPMGTPGRDDPPEDMPAVPQSPETEL